MKILIAQDWLRSGGTERQSVLLANAFAAAGNDTTLLTFRPGGALDPTVDQRVRRVGLQPFDTRLDWFAPGLARAVRGVAPDVTLCMGRMANCLGGAMRRAARSANPRAVVVCTMRTGKSLPRLFRQSLHRADHIVANSREARDTLARQHAIRADRISVIYNSLVFPSCRAGSPNRATSPETSALRTAHGASPATTVLLCVAMFRPEKNQRELIEIMAGLPPSADVQLWLAGEGSEHTRCKHLAASLGLSERVQFLGFQRDPSALYGGADIAVHASGSEALSNFLIEAQAHGLPCVAYAAQGIAECFIPDQTGWVIARGDRAAFRARILDLAGSNSASRAARAATASDFARTTFDPARQVSSYLDLFAALSPR